MVAHQLVSTLVVTGALFEAEVVDANLPLAAIDVGRTLHSGCRVSLAQSVLAGMTERTVGVGGTIKVAEA